MAEQPTNQTVWRQVWEEHGLWAGIVGAHLLIGLVATEAGTVRIVDQRLLHLGSWRYFTQLLGVSLFSLVAILLRRRLQVRDPDGRKIPGRRGWALGLQRFRADVTPARLIGGVLSAALIVLTFAAHDSWKATLGVLEPYTWDATLGAVDRALHGGRYPWEWLQPLLGVPARTRWIDRCYTAWYPILGIGLGWYCWNPNRRQRTRFFVALALTWVVLGTIVAHLFASGGPIFYAGLTAGPDPYGRLRAYLFAVDQQHPLTAMLLEHAVWVNYAQGARSFWISMSAMPSLHVAVIALFAMSIWQQSRVISIAVWCFTFLILLGSVHLGWHYAIDGYVALIGTWGLWRASRWAVP